MCLLSVAVTPQPNHNNNTGIIDNTHRQKQPRHTQNIEDALGKPKITREIHCFTRLRRRRRWRRRRRGQRAPHTAASVCTAPSRVRRHFGGHTHTRSVEHTNQHTHTLTGGRVVECERVCVRVCVCERSARDRENRDTREPTVANGFWVGLSVSRRNIQRTHNSRMDGTATHATDQR